MKYLCLVLVLVVTQGHVIERIKRAPSLKAPDMVKVTAIDPAGFEVEWKIVENSDKIDPVIGYKLYVWKIDEKKHLKYQVYSGHPEVTVTMEQPQQLNFELPQSEPTIYSTKNTKYTVTNIERGPTYEVRVKAYTKKVDGPLSNPIRIQLERD